MAIIESADPGVRTLRGLHLYHAGRSVCSARVRYLLEEKQLPWESHYVDIYQRANVTPAYFAINPKGLVPTLVHDGTVVVESNDIMLYLEEQFPEPSFSPADVADRERMRSWLRRSGDIHLPGIKTWAYAKSHAKTVVKTAEEVALYRSLQKDPELLAFHAKHDLPGQAFSDSEVNAAAALVNTMLAEMDAILARDHWLVAGSYSMADISLSPCITTLSRVEFPLGGFPNVLAWYRRCSERPAFQRAVTDWQSK